MDIEALSGSSVGQLVPLRGHDGRFGDFDYYAFLAHPLPDVVQLSPETWTSVTRASAALAQLDQVCRQLPDPRLLIRPALWREALDTSALEGTVGALQDLLEAQLPSAQYLSPETAEILAYERVALHAFDVIGVRPISAMLLCELQGELLKDVEKPPRDLGRLRQEPVWIGPRNRPIHESRFVPAPAGDRLAAGMEDWEKWVSGPHVAMPPVVQTALAHYQFEALHPFGDGNGRIGRLVVVLQLLRSKAIHYPAITVSPWFLKRRQEYQDRLLGVSTSGDWDAWVAFFSQAVADQCSVLVAGAEGLLTWFRESRAKLDERRWTGAIHRLLENLIEWPVTTITDTATRYGVTQMNATRMVNHLVEIGVLEELTGRSYGRVFGATFVMNTVDAI